MVPMKKEYRTVTRKLKWYNKLWIAIKEKMFGSIIYSTELKNRMSMARFIWSQKILIFFLFVPIILIPIL